MALSNTVSAISREKFLPVLVDNIFNSNALCLKLLKNAEKLDGGVKINVPIEYNIGNTNEGWLVPGGGTATGIAIDEIAQKSYWDWATSYNACVISSDEVHINQGSNQVLSILKAKMKNAEKSIKDLFGTGMFAAAAVSNGLTTLNGAGTLASDDYTGEDAGGGILETLTDTTVFHAPGNVDNAVVGYNRTLGGINSDSLTWWDSTLGHYALASGTRAEGAIVDATDNLTFAEFCTTSEGVAAGVKAWTRMYGHCSIDSDQPDLIVTTQEIYDAYESSLQANKRYSTGDDELADAGFQSLKFKGASVVVDSHCPSGQTYFLNTKYLDFKVHSKRFFTMEDFKPMEQYDRMQARIFFMGQLVCSAPRMQGMLVAGPAGY